MFHQAESPKSHSSFRPANLLKTATSSNSSFETTYKPITQLTKDSADSFITEVLLQKSNEVAVDSYSINWAKILPSYSLTA